MKPWPITWWGITIISGLVFLSDRAHRLEARGEARLGHEALERVLHVVGDDLAAIHRGLVVEAHTLAQRERVDLAIPGHRPLLGEIGQDREIGGALLLRAVRKAHELSVAQAHVRVAEKVDGQVRIEARSE